MTLEVIVGLPGSGKTSAVIRTVKQLRHEGRPVKLFVCSDAVEFSPDSSPRQHNRISSRDGMSCEIDHFDSRASIKEALAQIAFEERSTLVFDEAQYFGVEFVAVWAALSERGHRVIISTPTENQINRLRSEITEMTTLVNKCALFADGDATQFFVLPDKKITISVCDGCAALLREKARNVIEKMLVEQEPHQGERRVYQPVDLPFDEFKGLEPIRQDSEARVAIMRRYIEKELGAFQHRSKSYIDVGCNTGFFCKKMADIGFESTGIDVVPGDIRVATLLDQYFYRRYMNFICEDALAFVENGDREYDVVSTFSVFQWIYIQSEKARVDAALEKLFRKAKSLVFFEMGYTEEKHYKNRLVEKIDREWCYRKLEETKLFKDIVLIKAGEEGIKRDFFVAIKK